MDAGRLPAFVGPMALPPDDGVASAGVADETAERGFVAALAGALGDDDKGSEPARCRGGAAAPVHRVATPGQEPVWPLLAATFGLPGADALDQGDELVVDHADAQDHAGSESDGAGVWPAGGAAHALAAGIAAAVPAPAAEQVARHESSVPGGQADARPGADTSMSFPDSDERSPMGTRAAFGRLAAGPEPARDEVDHGPLADAGRAENGKLTGRTLFGGVEQGEPTLDAADAGHAPGIASQARWSRAVEQQNHHSAAPAPVAPHPPRPAAGATMPDPAAAGRGAGLSSRAAELAALASRGAADPSASAGAPRNPASTAFDRAQAEPSPGKDSSPQLNPTGSIPAAATIAASAAAGRQASPADLRLTDVWPEELVQQVAIAGRALPGVGPRANAETTFGGQDSAAGRGSLARGHADAAVAALAALGRTSPGEFAARISTLTQGATPAFHQTAPEPTVDGQPASHAIVQSLRVQWRQGGGEAKLRLQPEHLGDLSLSLRVQGSTVSVVLRSDSPAVRGWIDTHQAELRRALEAQGLVLDRFVIDSDDDPRQPQQESAPGDEAPQRRRRQAAPGRFEALL